MKHFLSLLIVGLSCTVFSCTTSRPVSRSAEPGHLVQLQVTALQVNKLQEKGMLGVEDGDELTLLYSMMAYDAGGDLVAVNNGFWGTRTIGEGTTIPTREFDKIGVHVPADGRLLVAFSLLEIDDYNGERRIAKIKPHTKAERAPKYLSQSTYAQDEPLTPIQLVASSLRVGGYTNLISRHLNLSSNDDLGGTKKAMSATELAQLERGGQKRKDSFEIDGAMVNESFNYQITYTLEAAGDVR